MKIKVLLMLTEMALGRIKNQNIRCLQKNSDFRGDLQT